jgi:hypothetical protein
MHAVAMYALISQQMLLIEMHRGEEQTNETRHEGPEGALLFLRAIYKVGKRRKQVPQRGTILASLYVESDNLYKGTQFYLSTDSTQPFESRISTRVPSRECPFLLAPAFMKETPT